MSFLASLSLRCKDERRKCTEFSRPVDKLEKRPAAVRLLLLHGFENKEGRWARPNQLPKLVREKCTKRYEHLNVEKKEGVIESLQ